LQQLLLPSLKLSSGRGDLTLSAKGRGTQATQLEATVDINQLSLQSQDGKKATEDLSVTTTVKAIQRKRRWHWQHQSVFNQGNLYIEPLYLENKQTAIQLNSKGWFNPITQQIAIDHLRFTHPSVGFAETYAFIELQPKFKLASADIYLNIKDLQKLSEVYLNTIIETTSLEGLTLKGKIEAGLRINQHQPDQAYLMANQLQLQDSKERVNLEQGVLMLHWSKKEGFKRESIISWQQLALFAIPLPRSYLTLLLKDQQITLLKAVTIPLLGGEIAIDQFDWQMLKDGHPKVAFAAKLKAISLEALTKILGIKALSGNISGDIPGVNFEAGKLSLQGGLSIHLLGGEIKINQLALSGLSTDFVQFYSDIAIEHLDLKLLTQKFEFGGMEGALSGVINNLYMENWKPIQFYAWLGTPENDESVHQISQKAIENLASIGGGGAVDFVSRIILGLFDNFDYDQIGLGCYLHQGICQLMGAKAAGKHGFYIVKGGGLPRIDVMGYNTRIDWKVLWQRLNRLSKTGKVVVEDP
jgi:hypothetical protein